MARLIPAEDKAEYQRAYYEANREKIRARQAAYRAANHEKVAAGKRDYYQRVTKAKLTPELRREAHLMSEYGLTPQGYEDMLVSQDGKCAGCGTTDPGKGHQFMLVDHDHRSGDVRGLLCFSCNTALGMVGDDSDTLISLAAYLMRAKATEIEGD